MLYRLYKKPPGEVRPEVELPLPVYTDEDEAGVAVGGFNGREELGEVVRAIWSYLLHVGFLSYHVSSPFS